MAGWSLGLGAVLGLALPAGAGAAAPAAKRTGKLSPALAELAKSAVRSKDPAQQARILGIAPSGPGSLLRRGGRVTVRVRFDHGAIASGAAVQAAGGQILGASRRYQSATVAVDPADLRALAAVGTVASVTPVRTPMTFAVNCLGGSVVSEGVAQLHADEARESFGVEGLGATVGVLSDSYDQATEAATGGPIATHAEEDVATADLPGVGNTCTGQTLPVNVLQDLTGEGEDEGRGMLQIVHDMAPKAALSFATAFESEEGFAENIENLALAGAKVLVDDVGYFEEPMFQDGPIANAITKVTSVDGATYLSAAGNDNLFDGEGNEIASWEAPAFRDSGGCPAGVVALGPEFNPSHCLDFNPGPATDQTDGIEVEPGETLSIDLQWAEPWYWVKTDIDAFLLNGSGAVIAGSAEANLVTQRPLEIVQWTNESGSTKTVQLAINRFSGSGARLKFILLQNGGGVSGVEYSRSIGGDVVGPSIYGHAGSADAIAVGAVPYTNSSKPERYSSRGPVTHYFGPVNGTTPASPLFSPEVLSKPDIAATDCGGTTFFAFFSTEWHFCGTSAAAPHAAGAVALMKEAEPPAGTAALREALVGTASGVGAFGPCAVGGGLVNAQRAVEAIKGEISVSEQGTCEPPESEEPEEEGEAPEEGGGGSLPPSPTPTPTVQGSSPSNQSGQRPAPNTRIRKHPRKVVRTHRPRVRLVFRFASDQAGASFRCRIDRQRRWRRCGARLVRRFPPGRHVVKVRAVSSAGIADPTPAVFRFRVKRVR